MSDTKHTLGSNKERCVHCDDETGRAGQFDDSLFLDNGIGPLCEDCYDAAIAKAKIEPQPQE